MNESHVTELKVAVEQVVRPLPAGTARKRRMREELLAHVLAIYEEEMAKNIGERAAVDQTLARLGDPEEISRRFRSELRWTDRIGACLDRLFVPECGRPVSTITARVFGLMILVHAAIILAAAMLLPTFAEQLQQRLWGPLLRIVLVNSITAGAIVCFLLTIPPRIGRLIHGRASPRPWVATIPYAVGSLLAVPLYAFAAFLAITGDLAGSVNCLWFAVPLAPLLPMVMYLSAKPAWEEASHREQWETLHLD